MKNHGIVKMLIFTVLALWVVACSTSVRDENIPVTTGSESARLLYDKADAFFEKVYIPQAVELLEEALAEDPNFFMAAYDLATYHMYFEDIGAFIEYAKQAVHSEMMLSKGEDLLKGALQKLLEDQKADVTEIGRKLIELYPKDPDAYLHLSFFQQIIGDYQGQVATLMKAAEIKEDPANVFNMIGYANMDIKDYGKAYESFMKAVEIDSTWTGSMRKANKARAMMKTDHEE